MPTNVSSARPFLASFEARPQSVGDGVFREKYKAQREKLRLCWAQSCTKLPKTDQMILSRCRSGSIVWEQQREHRKKFCPLEACQVLVYKV